MIDALKGYRQAVAAYEKASGASAIPGLTEKPSSPTGFSAMVMDAMNHSIAAGKATEKQAEQAVGSGGDLTQVVTAVSEAETTLQSIVAVRERVMEAYKEIMRMPV